MASQHKVFLAVTVCVLHCYLVFGASLPQSRDDTELVLVHVIFRHGERTTYRFYPNDPNQNETFYPTGLGGLTNKGKMGEFKLGEFLRNLYGDFLGPDYTEDKVYVRSTDTPRTKMSAQLALAGLFPPSEDQMWNADLLWQPIPVEYKSSKDEDVFHTVECPFKKSAVKELANTPEVYEKYIKPNMKLYNYISEKSGMEVNNPIDLLEFYFILSTENDLNMTLPEWTKEIYPEPLYSRASQVYEYVNSNPEVRRINAGYLLSKILRDTISIIQNINHPEGRKIFLYSGHETTLGFMLEALQVLKPHIPPYGSAIMFEVHRKGQDHFIKLRYKDSTTATRPRDIKIPDCEVLCPIEKFLDLQADIIPTKPLAKACEDVEKVPDEIAKQSLSA